MPEKNSCRLCSTSLSEVPSFKLNNLPLGVQYFPDKDELKNDKPVSIDIYRCDSCGFVQVFGNQVVYEGEHSAATSISPAMVNYKIGQAEGFIEKYNLKGKNILEAGSGDGHFLKMLTDAGVKLAVGVEPSVKSKESSVFKDVKVYSDYITKTNILKEGPFDAFATFHVLEHIPNIHDFIAGISVNLKEGAIGLVEVPSSELIEEDFRFYDFINDHLNYFTLRTLKLVFEMHNFEILDSYRSWNNEHNNIIVKKRNVYDFKALTKVKSDTIDNLLKSLNEYEDAKTAVWGASMHALTLLSQLSTNKIKWVIDSAEYKQNKFTPVTHFPIISPKELKFEMLDFIIVIAPRFVDEIVDDLKNKIKFKGKIAILDKDKVVYK